jgi:hypothetical protein
MVLNARLATLRLGSLLRSSYVAQAGQAEVPVEEVYPACLGAAAARLRRRERTFAKGRLVAAKPCSRRAKTNQA